MQKYVVLEKAVGATPLSTIEAYRAENPERANVPMTYAGRLDPMASGKLVILIGDECKRRTAYDGLDKEYEFEVLFDIASDTGDVLGMPTVCASASTLAHQDIERVARELTGALTLPYPAYSSKTVQGKPLFEWTLEGRLGEIAIPRTEILVHRMQYVGIRSVPARLLREYVLGKLSTLKTNPRDTRLGSDFRKAAIEHAWRTKLAEAGIFRIASFQAIVSSGTHIRSLAPLIAEALGTRGLAFSIHRTRIGRYRSLGPLAWWSRSL